MKNCEEMVGSLLRRRAEYEENRKKRRKTMLRLSGAVCSLALVVFIGAGVNGGWCLAPEPELPTVTPTQSTGEPAAVQQTTAPIQQPTCTEEPVEIVLEPEVVKNQITINGIDGISSDRMYIALMIDDFVPMSNEELNDYYGIDIFPEVPEDLGEEWSAAEGIPFGIFRRDGGTGEVYHDQVVLNWSNEDFSRSVNIELKKGGMPFQCFGVMTQADETSVISGVEVFIGQNDEGICLVEFMYQDVGFRMVVEGLTQEELVAVVESLICE